MGREMGSKTGSLLLLSGGLDSTVAAALAVADFGVTQALTFDYGQRAGRREVDSAAAIARRLEVAHRVIELPWLAAATRTALVDRRAAIPQPSPHDLDSPAAHETARAVWVPNRNGVFIAIAAALAEGAGIPRLVVGFNREEGTTFPDNSEAFVAATNRALSFSTLAGVEVVNPVGALDKVEIVRLGREVGAPIPLVWSCYLEGEEHCGTCESCRRLERALDLAGATTWFRDERARARAR